MAKLKMTFTPDESKAAMEFLQARLNHLTLCNGNIMSVPMEERKRLTLSLEDTGRQISRRYRIGGLNKLITLVEQVQRLAMMDEFIDSIPAPQKKEVA